MKRTRKLLQDSSKRLCRALGLNVITFFLIFLRHRAVGKGYTEHTRITIRRSRTTTLLRALIHLSLSCRRGLVGDFYQLKHLLHGIYYL